ncbi:CPBP family intramembrane glutamic endopeptidase [Propionibacteriaceae bacterium Y1685]
MSEQQPIGTDQPVAPGWTTHGPTTPAPTAPVKARRQPHADGLEYHQALRTPGTSWWRGVAAIIVFVIGFVIVSSVFGGIAIAIDTATGRVPIDQVGLVNSPIFFALSIFSLALVGPLAALTQWAFFGQRPRWIHSVTGGLRWGWLGRLAAVLIPVMAVSMIIFNLPAVTNPQPAPEWLWYLLVAIFLVPFQSAGEEYGFRGLINRSAATWSGNPHVAFALGTVISSVLFMFAHGAGDPWLNVYYFSFGVLLCTVARLTGGLEGPIMVHVANNLTALVISALTQDLSGMFDRAAGTGGPFMLIQIVFVAAISAGIIWWSRRQNLQTRTGARASSRPTISTSVPAR